jgi:hypothetical protein
MAKSPVTGWRACELEQRAGKSTCIQPPYRHRGGCNSVVVPCRCPIARTCCHEPNCRLQARPSPSCPCLLHQQPFSTNRAQTGSIMHQQLHSNCTQKTALAMVRSTRTRKLYESLARKTTCHATRNCALSHQLTIVRQKTRTDNSQSNVCQIPTHKLLCAENTRTRTYIRKTSHANRRADQPRARSCTQHTALKLPRLVHWCCFVLLMVYHALLAPLAAPQNSSYSHQRSPSQVSWPREGKLVCSAQDLAPS